MRLKISEKQSQFLQSQTKGTIFRGGVGSGKSRIICYKAILNALVGRRQLIVSFSFPMLRDVILHTIMEVLPLFGLEINRDYIINKTEMSITLRGTQILLRSGDAPDSIRGLNVHDFYIDEARNFKTDEIFLICLGRIRECEDSQWFISSSPRGKDWVYLLAENDKEVTLIVQKTTENPFLPSGYVDELRKRYTSKFALQEIDAGIVEMGAGVINPDWFNLIGSITVLRGVRYWDTAVSTKTSSDFSAGALCCDRDGKFTIANIIRGKYAYPDLRRKIIATAKIDGTGVIIGMEQVGQTKAFVDDLRSEIELKGYVIRPTIPKGDKFNRALPWVSRAEAGNVDIVISSWNQDFRNECMDFTPDLTHQHDDEIDAVSGAYQLVYTPITTTAHKKLY